jgi:hypothetical protein
MSHQQKALLQVLPVESGDENLSLLVVDEEGADHRKREKWKEIVPAVELVLACNSRGIFIEH